MDEHILCLCAEQRAVGVVVRLPICWCGSTFLLLLDIYTQYVSLWIVHDERGLSTAPYH